MRPIATRILSAIWYRGLERMTRFRLADLLFTYVAFWTDQGRFPDLRRPRMWSEHLTKLKLSGEMRSPMRARITDKETLKEYVAETLGASYAVPTLAILRTAEEIDRFRFPETCMIKPTHSSGRFVARRDGDRPVPRDELKSWLAHNYYSVHREANYRKLTPKIIIEELVLFGGELPLDYKIHCFHGQPKLIHVIANAIAGGSSSAIYSARWAPLAIEINKPGGLHAARPENLDELLSVASRLSRPFTFVRVDLYTDGKRILVGELTSLPAAGSLSIRPAAAEYALGKLFANPEA
jgi:hypothetical protein